MGNIYINNCKLIEERFKWIFDDLQELKAEDISGKYNVCSYQTKENTVGLYIDCAEKGIVQLGSQYYPSLYAEKWLENKLKKNKIEHNSVIFIFGLGSGEYLKALNKCLNKDNVVIVLEPELEVLKQIIEKIDLSEIMKENIFLVSGGENSDKIFLQLQRMNVRFSNLSILHFFDLPNYRNLFPEEYNKYKDKLKKHVGNILLNMNTLRKFEGVREVNCINSLRYFEESKSLHKLVELIPDNKPAIIISAGPSLDKNIDLLKEVKGKIFLIATDTALKPLLKRGIIPHMFVTLDAEKNIELFDDERVKDIPVLAMFDAREQVLEKMEGGIFFEYSNKILSRILKKIDDESGYRGLVQGGSVAHLAFSFALQAKMNPVIFVGQDLAFPGNKTHIDGAFNESTVIEDTSDYMYIEDIYGNMVPTRYDMKHYKEWFEQQIATYRNEDVKFIDATEGGAKIEGTKIMTLKEVISKYAKEDIDYEQIIKDTPLFLEGKLRERYLDLIYHLPDEIEEIIEKGNLLLEQYKRIDEISNEEILNMKELEEILEVISECNEYLDNEAVLTPMLEEYKAFILNQATINVDKSFDDVNEDLKDIARRGIMMSDTIVKSAEDLKPNIIEVVDKMKEKYKK